jgi:hypothetical protein
MGLDRFANFISKSINNDGIEEININNNIRKIVSNHIIFDLNFLIYQEIIEVENEINDIIKIILCLPYICSNGEILEEQLKTILNQSHWKIYCNENDISAIFDGFNEDDIIHNFIIFITSSTTSNTETTNEEITILELVVYEKIVNVMIDLIEKIHNSSFIQSLSIFFDGIPSISKVIEQRRRRIKNYLESIEKKTLFKTYFNNLNSNHKKLNGNLSKKYSDENISEILMFDYFKWIKNRFSMNKSIGPSSKFIKNLETFLNFKITKNFPKSSIYINSAKENGESDVKIFKNIADKDVLGDFCIHTTDSDLIHQILVQQSYYKIISKDINLTVAKYIKNYNTNDYVQILEAIHIIKNILDLYNNVNNIKTNNYKIIWDLCLMFYLFGNDHLPSSVEIGPELGLEFFLKKHFQALEKSNIVNIKKTYITLDLANLKLMCEKIYETNNQNITRIYLSRFFKLNINFINVIVDKLGIDYTMLNDFLKKFIIYRACQLSEDEFDKLNECDMRKVYLKEIDIDEREKYMDLIIFGFNENQKKTFIDSVKLIEENIDYYETQFTGLIVYTKPMNLTSDPYQDIYNYIVEKSSLMLNKYHPIFYDYIDINLHYMLIENTISKKYKSDSNDYLKKIYHLIITQFGSMKEFHTDNITFYKYNTCPSLNNIIEFLKINLNENLTKKWLKEIKEENIKPDKYLNSISHHILITPFLFDYGIPNEISILINAIGPIDNLWINNIYTFNYRDIDINYFFKKWNEAIIKVNLINKSNKINRELINLHLEFIS